MSIDRQFGTRESSVRPDEELLVRTEEQEEDLLRLRPAPGKRSRTHSQKNRKGRGKGQPGKSSLTAVMPLTVADLPRERVPLVPSMAKRPRRGASGAQARPARVMRKATGRRHPIDLDTFLHLITSSTGTPLPRALADRLSALLRHDVSHARIHKDAAAARAAEAVNARAFTVGSDVFFGPGTFAPDTAEGERLLAHELAHVKQHDEGRLSPASSASEGVEVSDPSQPLEREADAVASRIASPAASETRRHRTLWPRLASAEGAGSAQERTASAPGARAASAPGARTTSAPGAPAASARGMRSLTSLARMATSTVLHREAATSEEADNPVEEAKTISLRLLQQSADVEIQPPLAGSHSVSPSLSHPGATLTSAQVSLDGEGALQSGTATLSVDGGGAVESSSSQHDITVDSPTSGTIATEVQSATSSLGQIIDGISVDARLIDGGVEAEITISAGQIAGVDISGGTVSVRYVNGTVTAEGQIGLSALGGKLTGEVNVAWEGGDWSITGTGTVSELLPDLEPFDVEVAVTNGELTMKAAGIEYSREIGAVSMTGSIEEIRWEEGGFAGEATLELDLGIFGAAVMTASVANDALVNATVEYTSPELRYPAEGEPVLTGQANATFTYEDNQISATFDGSASLELGALTGQDVSGAALSIEVSLDSEGNYAGTIASTEPLRIGEHFAINGMTLNVAEGQISGDFTLEVTDAPFISAATVNGQFGEGGLVLDGELTLSEASVGGVEITSGTVNLSYSSGAITGQGQIGISAAEGKLTGNVDVGYSGESWTVTGTGTVSELIPGVEPFDVSLSYADEQITIEAEDIVFESEVGAVTMNGRVERLAWDQEAGGFSGDVTMDLDLKLFGTATASAAIENNTLTSAEVSYDQPEFRYPGDSEAPVLTGSVQGTLTYDPEGLSGTINGTANLALGEAASNLELAIDATLSADGTYGGTIATTERLTIGDHFAMDGLTLTLSPEGDLSGEFALEVVDVPFLSSASVNGTFGPDGLELAGQLDVSGGGVSGFEITGGAINVEYAGGAITGEGQLELSAGGGKLTATMDAAYDGQSWTVSGTGQVQDLIPNLEPFDVSISYENELFTVQAENVEYQQDLGAISLSGRVESLEWDQESGGFSGAFELDVDLKLFGEARATAQIQNNELSEAVVEYTQPELKYPYDSDAPVLTGSVEGSFTLNSEGLSGTITGSADLAVAGMAGEGQGLALSVEATLNADGTYSGSISSVEQLEIGAYFVLNSATLTLAADGSVSGDVSIDVVNVPFLDEATVTGSFGPDGLDLSGELQISGGGLGAVEVTGGSIAVTYADGVITGQGTVDISAIEGKLTASLNAGYDGESWSLSGTGTVSELIPNLGEFEISVAYENEQFVIEAQNVEYSQTIGAITLTGTIDSLAWDQESGAFSGQIALDVDLGLFGEATASATLENNAVTQWTVEYTTPELRYPKDSDSPLFTGQITGSLSFENDQLSGTFNGTANIDMPELLGTNGSNLGLSVDAALDAEGNYSGTIATTERLEIGDYFAIPGMSATLEPDGSLSGEFSVEVVNLPYLESASITCAVDESGLTVREANASAAFGEEGGRAWGTVSLSYQEGDGFIIEGDANIKLSEGMVATGELRYTTATNEVTATLGMDEVTLFEMGDERTLLEFDKKVIVFTLYQIVGLYLDVGFDLAFNYDLNLRMKPEVTLSKLSLEDWSFEEASAEVGFLGALAARLTATPHIGVGAFAGHPKILRGGGGVGVPIVANAELTPSGKFGISFNPQGGVDGDATLGLVLTFEVNGSVVPYAEFSVLDGVLEERWQGDSLADFEILPKRELFSYLIDFNALDEEPAQPELPTTLQEPSETSASTVWEQDAGAPTQTSNAASADAAPEAQGAHEEAADDASGLSIGSLVGGLLDGGSLGALRDLIDAAAGVWESIQQNIEALRSFFSNWFSAASGTAVEVLRTIQEEGFFGFLKKMLQEQLGEEVYHVFEPLLEAAGDIETQLVSLLNQPLSSMNFETMLQFVSDLLGLAWSSLPALVSAIGTVVSRAASAGERLVGLMVSEGKIGVRRHGYYVLWHNFLAADEYKIRVLGANTHHRNEGMLIKPQNAVAFGLWTALQGLGSVNPTNTSVHERSGDVYNDYWV